MLAIIKLFSGEQIIADIVPLGETDKLIQLHEPRALQMINPRSLAMLPFMLTTAETLMINKTSIVSIATEISVELEKAYHANVAGITQPTARDSLIINGRN